MNVNIACPECAPTLPTACNNTKEANFAWNCWQSDLHSIPAAGNIEPFDAVETHPSSSRRLLRAVAQDESNAGTPLAEAAYSDPGSRQTRPQVVAAGFVSRVCR